MPRNLPHGTLLYAFEEKYEVSKLPDICVCSTQDFENNDEMCLSNVSIVKILFLYRASLHQKKHFMCQLDSPIMLQIVNCYWLLVTYEDTKLCGYKEQPLHQADSKRSTQQGGLCSLLTHTHKFT
eukprot:scaffold74622_cov64-Attheya_sp.AAC.1